MNQEKTSTYLVRKSPVIRTLLWISLAVIFTVVSLILGLRVKEKPVIYSLNPPIGSPGDLVIITGKDFGNIRDTNYVEFGGYKLTSSSYISWSNTEIKVVLPANVQEGLVVVGTKNARSKPAFFANTTAAPVAVTSNSITTTPVITIVSPEKIYPGTLLTISGSNFGPTRERSKVYFSSEREATQDNDFSYISASEDDFDYEYWSDGEIHVRVPDGASSGNFYVETSKGKSPARKIEIDERAGKKSFISPKTYVVQIYADVEDSSGDKDSSIILRCPRPFVTASQPSVQLTECTPEPVINDFQHTIIQQVSGKSSFGKKRFKSDFAITVYETRTQVYASRLNPVSTVAENLRAIATKEDNLVPSGDPDIIALSKKITKGESNHYNMAALIYNYMLNNYVILNDVRKGNISPLDLIRTKKGDAYDFAVIYTALLRACGIPSYTDSGILVETDLKTQDHWWSEFYLAGFGWIPVDPALGAGLKYSPWQKDIQPETYYFGNLDAQHIVFSRGWNEIKPSVPNSKIVQKPRSYALQDIWEEASGEKIKYSSYWANPIVIGVY